MFSVPASSFSSSTIFTLLRVPTPSAGCIRKPATPTTHITNKKASIPERPPLTPDALRDAVLFADPNHHRFRSFELEERTLRLHWPAEGKWPTFTWPDDVRGGAMVDREPVHFGWM